MTCITLLCFVYRKLKTMLYCKHFIPLDLCYTRAFFATMEKNHVQRFRLQHLMMQSKTFDISSGKYYNA